MLGIRGSRLHFGTLALPALFACGDDHAADEHHHERVSLGVVTAPTLSVELLADEPLEVGSNHVYYRVRTLPGGVEVSNASIQQTPIMHMSEMDMEHSCPCEQPPSAADHDGVFPGVIVFQMASSMSGAWRNEVTVDLGDGAGPVEVVFEDLAVAASDARRDLTLGDGKAAIVTLTFAEPPAVGENLYTVTVHQKSDMMGMAWDALTDLTIEATPDMPSMGHGSTGNTNPAHVASGRYEGWVNLTMPGAWRIVLAFSRAGVSVGTVEYTFTL